MAQPARPLLSFDEYLRIEGDSLVRHEYVDGVVWAMGGGTDEHAALAANSRERLNRGVAQGRKSLVAPRIP